MLQPLLAHLAVDRLGPGRPRTRPEAVIGDKAYSSRAIRADLRSRGIRAVIPQPSDQIAHRKHRGSAGGKPPAFDAKTYEGRTVIERSFNDHKQWRGLGTHYDKLAAVYRGGVVLRAITIWLTTQVVSSPACSVSCRRLASSAQRSCGPAANSMRMPALSTTFDPALLKRVKNFSFRGCIRRPSGDPPGPTVPP